MVGYFLVPMLVSTLATLLGVLPKGKSDDAQILYFVTSLAWVAALAFCARFLLGREFAKPGGMWSCPNCRYLNQPYAVICEACRQPYAPKS